MKLFDLTKQISKLRKENRRLHKLCRVKDTEASWQRSTCRTERNTYMEDERRKKNGYKKNTKRLHGRHF